MCLKRSQDGPVDHSWEGATDYLGRVLMRGNQSASAHANIVQ